MKTRISLMLFFLAPFFAFAQTETTRSFMTKNPEGVFSVYFYKNTLRMLNQSDSKEFDEMIKGIEKLRFLMIDKAKLKFGNDDYKKLVKSYVGESYEQMMTSRLDGRNFDVYMKDKKGSPLGTIVLVNDSSTLYVMDMIGRVDLSKASQVFNEMQKNSDISGKIQNFLNHDKSKKEKNDDDDEGDAEKHKE